jgi:hypothetical protein
MLMTDVMLHDNTFPENTALYGKQIQVKGTKASIVQ